MSENRLLSLGGEEVSAELRAHLGVATRLPERAQAAIWEVLDAVIVVHDPQRTGEIVEGFAKVHGIQIPDLDAATHGLNFLLQGAAARNLSPEQFLADVRGVFAEAPPLVAALGQGYGEARQKIRTELQRRTLLDHGKVLTGLDWRIDCTMLSNRGVALNTMQALFTFQLREGRNEQPERVSMYVTRDALVELRRCVDLALTEVDRQAPPGG